MNFLMLQRDNEISAKVTSCHYKYLTEPDLCNTNDIGMSCVTCDIDNWNARLTRMCQLCPPRKFCKKGETILTSQGTLFLDMVKCMGVIVCSVRNTYILIEMNIWINSFSNSKRSNFPGLFERIQSPCLKEQFAFHD